MCSNESLRHQSLQASKAYTELCESLDATKDEGTIKCTNEVLETVRNTISEQYVFTLLEKFPDLKDKAKLRLELKPEKQKLRRKGYPLNERIRDRLLGVCGGKPPPKKQKTLE